MAVLALSLWAVYFGLALGLRVFVHARRTGESGLVAMRGRPGALAWAADSLELTAFGVGVAAPILAETFEVVSMLDRPAFQIAGVVVFALGLATVMAGQHAMHDSWRIGVDAGARTELVTHGPFALARNPIFTGVVGAQVGIALVLPNALAFAALALLVVSVQIQVRGVEEPYLLRAHGDDYADYARDVGRFVPGIGRLRGGR